MFNKIKQLTQNKEVFGLQLLVISFGLAILGLLAYQAKTPVITASNNWPPQESGGVTTSVQSSGTSGLMIVRTNVTTSPGGRATVSGEVKNDNSGGNGQQTSSGGTTAIRANFFNSAGVPIGTAVGTVAGVGPGRTANFSLSTNANVNGYARVDVSVGSTR